MMIGDILYVNDIKGRVSHFSKNFLENWAGAEYQNKLVANQQ